jgi:hypothetical protein
MTITTTRAIDALDAFLARGDASPRLLVIATAKVAELRLSRLDAPAPAAPQP